MATYSCSCSYFNEETNTKVKQSSTQFLTTVQLSKLLYYELWSMVLLFQATISNFTFPHHKTYGKIILARMQKLRTIPHNTVETLPTISQQKQASEIFLNKGCSQTLLMVPVNSATSLFPLKLTQN